MLNAELTGLCNALPQIFGYYLVQIGGPTNIDFLRTSSIHNRILINSENGLKHDQSTSAIQSNLLELPFLSKSIDAVLLFHIVEFTKKPQIVLHEIYNSLINGGHLVVFGFNPQSIWGITKFCKHSQKSIWGGNWYSPKKLRHWLIKIGFSVADYQTFYFRPPGSNPKKMLFMEGMGEIFWPYCGATYMVIAKKTTTSVTPLQKLSPIIRETTLVKSLPKPSSRVS